MSESSTEREKLVAVECSGNCGFTAAISRESLGEATCPGCDQELKVDTDRWVHPCPESASDVVAESRGVDCPFCGMEGDLDA